MIGAFHHGFGRSAAWLAIVALLLNGFVPGLHRLAMAHAAGDAAIVLCTGDGPVTVAVAVPAGDEGGPPPLAADDCCGLCILGAAVLIAPPPSAAALPAAAARVDLRSGDGSAVRPTPTGPPLPARGPPLRS